MRERGSGAGWLSVAALPLHMQAIRGHTIASANGSSIHPVVKPLVSAPSKLGDQIWDHILDSAKVDVVVKGEHAGERDALEHPDDYET